MNTDYIEKIDGAERRTFTHTVEIREEGEDKFFEGHAFVIGEIADLGGFTEEIAKGAADEVMSDDVRGLFNHDDDYVLGRTKSGTMQLVSDERGLRYKIKYNPNDPDHVRLKEKVNRGDVSQSSFAFSVKDDKWEVRNGKDHRTVLKLRRLIDVSLVTYPAYQNTSVAMRSLNQIDNYKQDLAQMDREIMGLSLNK
jgi:HK97 family phage prohead protease